MNTSSSGGPCRVELADKDRGSMDPKRCFEIGQRVLSLLERGVHRVEVFGHARKERIHGIREPIEG